MQLKTVRNIIFAISLATTVCLVLMLLTQIYLFGYLAIILAIAYCVFYLVFWRCPKCHKFLGRMQKQQFCRHCKELLEI